MPKGYRDFYHLPELPLYGSPKQLVSGTKTIASAGDSSLFSLDVQGSIQDCTLVCSSTLNIQYISLKLKVDDETILDKTFEELLNDYSPEPVMSIVSMVSYVPEMKHAVIKTMRDITVYDTFEVLINCVYGYTLMFEWDVIYYHVT